MNIKASTSFIIALLGSQCSSEMTSNLSVRKFCHRGLLGYYVTRHTVFNSGIEMGQCNFHTTRVCHLEQGFSARRDDEGHVIIKKGSQETKFGFVEGGCVTEEGKEVSNL